MWPFKRKTEKQEERDSLLARIEYAKAKGESVCIWNTDGNGFPKLQLVSPERKENNKQCKCQNTIQMTDHIRLAMLQAYKDRKRLNK